MINKIYARKEAWSDNINISLGEVTSTGKMYLAQELLLVESQPGAAYTSTLSLDPTMAQRMMDELWNCGVRPSEGFGSAGVLAATERHLKDLQELIKHVVLK